MFNKTQNFNHNPAFEFTDLDPSNQVSEIDEAYEDAEELSEARYTTIKSASAVKSQGHRRLVKVRTTNQSKSKERLFQATGGQSITQPRKKEGSKKPMLSVEHTTGKVSPLGP